MSQSPLRTVGCLVCLACLVFARRAGAQDGVSGRAYEGLFPPVSVPASVPSRAVPGIGLTLGVEAFGAYDMESAQAEPAASQRVGNTSGLRIETRGTRTGEGWSYDADAGTSMRRDPAVGTLGTESRWLEAAARLEMAPRTTLTASQRITHSPLRTGTATSMDRLNADSSLLITPDQAAASQASAALGTRIGVEHRFSRRTAVETTYSFDRVSFSNRGVDATNHRVTAVVSRAASRSVRVRAGYAGVWSTTMSAGLPVPVRSRLVEFGADVKPAFARRLSVSVGLSPSLTSLPAAFTQGRAIAAHDAFALQGLASVNVRLSARTRAGVGYQRTSSALQGTERPLLADAVTVRAEGGLSRRLDWRVAMFYSHGHPVQDRAQVESFSASARVSVRVNAATSLYVESSRDTSLAPAASTAAATTAGSRSRQAVRVGVAMSLTPIGGSRRSARR